MRKAILFFSLIIFGFNLSAQEFFSATAATADEAAHLRFMKMHNAEYEKRSEIWNVPPVVVRVIASAQSGAGYLSGHNYGAVLPASAITNYPKFSRTDEFDLVACSKASRGIELIALALNLMNSNTGGGLQTDEDYLQHVFGAAGELALMASEAEIAYKAFTNKEIYLDSGYTNPPHNASYSNSTPVVEQQHTASEVTQSAPTFSTTQAAESVTPPAMPNLMVGEKVIDTEVETETFEPSESFEATPVATETTESFEVESYTTETTESSYEVAPTEMMDDAKNVEIVIQKKETTGEVDAMGRRIIKDPADNINKIESYDDTASGSKIVKKIEGEEVRETKISSEEVDETVVEQEEVAFDKQPETITKRDMEIKEAAKTEAEMREAEILRAEEMIIQQRKEMAERRAKKAAEAEKAGNGGGN